MIGIFDSGVGGICAYREVQRLLPDEDIIYLADRKNAPYGTKTQDEILALTSKNIKILRSAGASTVLIACCTASSVYQMLSPLEREVSIPIITPAAMVAASGEKITVIATRHTAGCKVFSKEIARLSSASVTEIAEQELVSLVEGGLRDGRVSREGKIYLGALAERIKKTDADTLILGCTHFSHLERELQKRLPGVRIVSPAREGAIEAARKVGNT